MPPQLSDRTASGIFWMILGSGGQTVFQFVLFIVLARQLGPEAFGIIGIAAVFIELSGTIGRAGLTEVVIQQRELDEADASTAFWSSLGIGLIFTTLLYSGAIPLADTFAMPELEPVMQFLAPISTLFAVGAVYEAKLRRNYGFKALAVRNVTATFVSGIIAIVMALTGFGVYSLVAQRLIHVVWLLGAMVFSTGWVPSLVWCRRTGVSQLSKGSVLALSSVLGSGNQRIIDLIVGYVLGATALGYLRIAWRALDLLQELSVRQITNVTLTSLSRLQDDRPALTEAYLRIVQMTALFAYPMFLGAAVVAPQLIRFMFGAQWEPSVFPMQILILTAIFIPPLHFKSNLLMAVGAMRMVLFVNVFDFAASTLFAYVSSHYGLAAAAAGNVVRLAVVAPVIFWSVHRVAEVPVDRTLAVVLPPLLATGIMIAAVLALSSVLPPLPDILVVTILGGGGLAVYVVALWVVQRQQVIEIVDTLRKIAQRRRSVG